MCVRTPLPDLKRIILEIKFYSQNVIQSQIILCVVRVTMSERVELIVMVLKNVGDNTKQYLEDDEVVELKRKGFTVERTDIRGAPSYVITKK